MSGPGGRGDPCPCGTGRSYDACCGRLHRGGARAATAEQLMRSRYAAFAVGDAAYLLATWHPSTRPGRVRLDDRRWTGLEVRAVEGGGLLDQEGEVEFVAHFIAGGEPGRQGERSRFARHDGRWTYVAPVRPHGT